MSSGKASVLVVDDDIRMLRLMQRTLELEGYGVIAASGGDAALEIFEKTSPDLVLLDVILPGMDGYGICRRIRKFCQTPVIMVTCKTTEDDNIKGLYSGADDYVTKPFSTEELTARIRAVLRRSKIVRPSARVGLLCCHDLLIDFANHRVALRGKEIHLTATEYRLLSYMGRNAGWIVTAEQILENVWGKECRDRAHLLQVSMGRLRHKLDDDARNPKYILTRPGIGYTMMKENQAPPPTTQ